MGVGRVEEMVVTDKNKGRKLCRNCGHTLKDHPTKNWIARCPSDNASAFRSSGWYDGPPKQDGPAWCETTEGETVTVELLDIFNEGNEHENSKIERHAPAVIPKPPPIPKQEVKG